MKKSEDLAAILIVKARQDLAVCDRIAADPHIADEIIGFHIQQALEKSLKAMLAFHSIDFRPTHDLRELLDIMTDNNIAVPAEFSHIDEWTPFAVSFRYELIEPGAKIPDRAAAILTVRRILDWLEQMTGIKPA